MNHQFPCKTMLPWLATLMLTLAGALTFTAPTVAQNGALFEHQAVIETYRADAIFDEDELRCVEYCSQITLEKTTFECLAMFEIPTRGTTLPGFEGPIAAQGDLFDLDWGELPEQPEVVGYQLRTTTELIRRSNTHCADCTWKSEDQVIGILDEPQHLPSDVDPEPACSGVFTRTYETPISLTFGCS